MAALLILACLGLTSYRVTRLLVKDSFPPLEVQRTRVESRWGVDSWQAYLARCPWCMGVYVSGALTLATHHAVGGLPVPWLVWGAAAAAVGLLARLAGDGEVDEEEGGAGG